MAIRVVFSEAECVLRLTLCRVYRPFVNKYSSNHCASNLGAGGFWGLRGFLTLETGIYVLQFQICLGLNPTLMMMVVVLVELCIGL